MARHLQTDQLLAVPRPAGLAPEAISSRATAPYLAQLVDAWGRGHGIASPTSVGREVGRVDLGVLEASVSRQHAELRHDERTGLWTVRDLGSTNGTFVDGRRIDGPTALRGREIVAVGHVGFLFVGEPPLAVVAALRLRVGPGGGVAEQRGRAVGLGPAEIALLGLLAAAGRSFVPSTEIAAALTRDHKDVAPADVAPLARRTQAALAAAGMDELIEHRARFGYRLALPPEAITVEPLAEGGAPRVSTRTTAGMAALDAEELDRPPDRRP